jgi:hypothetical protein
MSQVSSILRAQQVGELGNIRRFVAGEQIRRWTDKDARVANVIFGTSFAAQRT